MYVSDVPADQPGPALPAGAELVPFRERATPLQLTDSAQTSCETSVMDVSDPQTLSFMLFGGFMVISAVAIALVSTLSMKETSYEEVLAKQRREIIQAQTKKSEKKKKKDKTFEKRSKAKKKEDRADGKLSEPGGDVTVEPVVVTCTEPESDPEPAAELDAVPEPKLTPEPEPVMTSVESPPAPSPKEKKKSARMDPHTVLETVAKEVLVLALAPVVDVPPANVTKETSAAKTEEHKETLNKKKKKSKNKPETASVTEPAPTSPLLPYGELLSAMSNMTLGDDQTHKLMEVLSQKAGVCHDSWQLV
ncbi:ribosome-binding protein 1b isoform X2 [Trachinotus anak]